MRTTMAIDDDLLKAAKARAAELGISVTEVVNRCLRRGLESEPRPKRTPRATITFGTPGKPFPTDAQLSRAADAADDDYLAHKLRTPRR